MSKDLSIIVPVHNQLAFTKKFIASVVQQKTNYDNVHVIIVDNASEADTINFIQKVESIGKFIFYYRRNDENLGFSKAVNQGIEIATQNEETTDLLITNNDVEFLEGCWDALYDCAYSDDKIGIVGGQLIFPDGRIQHAGAFLNIFGWGQHKGAGLQMDDPFVMKREEQEYVTGALFFIKNAAFQDLQSFDEQFSPAFFEETDYCMRAHVRGWKVVYEPTAHAIHYENTTGKNIYQNQETLKREISDKNQVKFYQKWGESLTIDEDADKEHKILLQSKIYGAWSFSKTIVKLAKGLDKAGVDVSIAPDEYHEKTDIIDWQVKKMIMKPNDYWNRAVLRHSEGDHMYIMPPGKKRIAYLALETTRLNPLWKEQLNQLDQVLAVSSFVKQTLLDGGVTVPIEVLPNCVDTVEYNPTGEKSPIDLDNTNDKTFKFYSMFAFGDRKGPDILLRAFIEEFGESDNVVLMIHSLSMLQIFKQQRVDLGRYIDSFVTGKKRAPIFVNSTYMPDYMLPMFMRNFDAFVLPSRGEGFGLPIMEAMACGQPVITTNFGGPTDFVSEEVGWPISYELTDTPLQYLTYFRNYIGGKWAEPSVDHLRQILRYVYEHPEEAKAKGKKAAIKAQEYDMYKIGAKAKNIIFGD